MFDDFLLDEGIGCIRVDEAREERATGRLWMAPITWRCAVFEVKRGRDRH